MKAGRTYFSWLASLSSASCPCGWYATPCCQAYVGLPVESQRTLIENRPPLGSYKYLPVRVICGRPRTPETRHRAAQAVAFIVYGAGVGGSKGLVESSSRCYVCRRRGECCYAMR